MATLFISHSSKERPRAEWLRAALQERGFDSLFLDSHPDDGIPAGTKWERKLLQALHALAAPWSCSAPPTGCARPGVSPRP